jgi:Tol biopolymer transport system component
MRGASIPTFGATLRCLLSASLFAVSLSACGRAEFDAERFGIYVTGLDGTGFRAVATSSEQEMTHARVSPDGRWITFTRYTERDRHGLATETKGYDGTEILRIRPDGSGMEVLVAAREGVINGNGSWTPDGAAILYVSDDNEARQPAIYRLDIAARSRERLPTPDGLVVTDPHQRGTQLVFPARTGEPEGLWMMNIDGTGLRRVTKPDIPVDVEPKYFALGDFDPRLSPGGRQLAFMRYFGAENWHVLVKDLESGEERDLSAPVTTDALPDWSPDGRWLVFWHADRRRLQETGLYLMRPDGSERRMLPLPRGYLYKHSMFMPDGRRLLTVARKDARIP